MGSSIFSSQALVLAIVSGILFLIFDAARFFVHQLSPMRLKRWSGSDPNIERGSRWFQYRPNHFSLLTGALLQISLVGAAAFTMIALMGEGIVVAAVTSIAIWGFVAIGWKMVLAIVPDGAAEIILRSLIPVSHFFYYLFWPLLFPVHWLLERVSRHSAEEDDEEEVTDEEVQAYIDVGEEEGILEKGEGKLVQSIVDFGDTIVREVMTPRMEMLAFESSGSIEQLAEVFSESKYSRIPLYQENIDRIVGMVHVKDLFDVFLRHEAKSVRDIARPAYFVAETKKVSELLREFQLEHTQMAIVVDEFGGTAGLVSIEDLIEEIVGEIADEHEQEEPTVLEIEDGVWLVTGATRIEVLEEMLGLDIRGDDDYETVAGLIFTQMGRVPKSGERTSKSGLTFEVDRADRRRIYRVRVSRAPEVPQEEVARG
ncbi:MAG: hemolysin family protein [Thermoanaerobaculia bacterium]